MNNVIQFPSAKYHSKYKVDDDLIEFIWDKALAYATKKQRGLQTKRIELADKMLEYLPDDKMLDNYDKLFNEDILISIDRVIKYMVENEATIKDKIVGYI